MNTFKIDLLSGQKGEDICKFALAKHKSDLQVIRPNSIKGASSVDLYLLSAGQSEFVGSDIKTDFKCQGTGNIVLETISQFRPEHCVKLEYKALFDGISKRSASNQINYDFINKLPDLPKNATNLPVIKKFPYEINQRGWAIKDFKKGLLIFCPTGPKNFSGELINKVVKKYQKKILAADQDLGPREIEKMIKLHDKLMEEVGVEEYYLLDVDKHKAYDYIRQTNLHYYFTRNSSYYTLGVLVGLEKFSEQPFVTEWHWKAK